MDLGGPWETASFSMLRLPGFGDGQKPGSGSGSGSGSGKTSRGEIRCVTRFVPEGMFVRTEPFRQFMKKKLTRTGNSVALVLDRPLLEQLGMSEGSEVEISSNGDVLVVTPVRDDGREARLRSAAARINERYAGLFRRLSE
jgi:antitoxin MazE